MFPFRLPKRVNPFFEFDNERDLMFSTDMHFLVKELMVDNTNT